MCVIQNMQTEFTGFSPAGSSFLFSLLVVAAGWFWTLLILICGDWLPSLSWLSLQKASLLGSLLWVSAAIGQDTLSLPWVWVALWASQGAWLPGSVQSQERGLICNMFPLSCPAQPALSRSLYAHTCPFHSAKWAHNSLYCLSDRSDPHPMSAGPGAQTGHRDKGLL